MANDIANYLKFNDVSVLLYTGEDSKIDENGKCHLQNKIDDLKDVDNRWNQC